MFSRSFYYWSFFGSLTIRIPMVWDENVKSVVTYISRYIPAKCWDNEAVLPGLCVWMKSDRSQSDGTDLLLPLRLTKEKSVKIRLLFSGEFSRWLINNTRLLIKTFFSHGSLLLRIILKINHVEGKLLIISFIKMREQKNWCYIYLINRQTEKERAERHTMWESLL